MNGIQEIELNLDNAQELVEFGYADMAYQDANWMSATTIGG